jgi:hypothetical protein
MGFTIKRKAVTRFQIGDRVRFVEPYEGDETIGTVSLSGFGFYIKYHFPSTSNLEIYRNIDPDGWYHIVTSDPGRVYYILSDSEMERI